MKFRCDFGAEIAAHGLYDDYHRARSADWGRITVPLLSAAATGVAIRCTCAATSKASCAPPPSRNGSEMHGDRHWTLFYTDYGNDLQKRFFGHFLKGEDTGWAAAAAGAAAGPPSRRAVRAPPRG